MPTVKQLRESENLCRERAESARHELAEQVCWQSRMRMQGNQMQQRRAHPTTRWRRPKPIMLAGIGSGH